MVNVKIHELYKEWAIKIGAGVATLLVCYLVVIHPVFRNIAALREEIKDSQKRRELYQDLQGLTANLNKSELVLATIAERSQLLGKVSDIAARTQLHVATLTPRTEASGGYTTLKMEMEGQGTFFSLLKFLQAVEQGGKEIRVRDVSMLWKSISGPQKEGGFPLQIQLVFETLLKQREKTTHA